MRSKFAYTVILASSIFLSHFTYGMTDPICQLDDSASEHTIEEYTRCTAENVITTLNGIFSIPVEEQTFENTLHPWIEISARLLQNYERLDAFVASDSPSRFYASQAKSDLNTFLSQIAEYTQLRHRLKNIAQHLLLTESLNALQYFMAKQFVDENSVDFASNTLALLITPIRHRDDERKSGNEFEGGVEYKFGGKNGAEIDLYVKGKASDDKGNYVEGKASRNNQGEGRVSVRGGRKNEKED